MVVCVQLTVEVSTFKDMETLAVNIKDSFPSLLALASHNDSEGFKLLLEKEGAASINEAGIWYGRQTGSTEIVLEHKTPLMVAATYGSIDVMKVILLYPDVDVNFACVANKSTALHCAASGGSANVVDAVRILISAGANVSCVNSNGNRPVDLIVVPPNMQSLKVILEKLLLDNASDNISVGDFSISASVDSSSSGFLENGMSLPYPPSVSPPSPVVDSKFTENKQYPVDPSFPGIKNSMYASDEFRMFSFKVLRCSRSQSHDWTECPYVHPGEKARRRDLRRFSYSCMACPEFRKGACRHGDKCEYAHGIFECWLHPDQYRTRLCKDRPRCNKKVCFFAHDEKELRPLPSLTGSGVPSPRSSASAFNAMELAAAMNLLVGSPPSVSSFHPSNFSQPMPPSGNGISFSSAAWAQQNVLGSNFQSNRLGSSLRACNTLPEDFNVLSYLDGQQNLMKDLSCFSQPGPSSCRSKALTPSNLEDLFSAEILSSPRYSDPAMASVFSPSHKSAATNELKQLQHMLSPSNINMLSLKNDEHRLLQASFGVPSCGSMSPRRLEPISPLSPQMSALPHREKQQQQLQSVSSRELGYKIPSSVVGSPMDPWSYLGSPNEMSDWSVNGDELSRQMHNAFSFEHKIIGNEEPNLSWAKVLLKVSSPEMVTEKFASSGPVTSSGRLNSNSQI